MSAMKKELTRIIVCGAVGIIIGLIVGIPMDVNNNFFGLSIAMPVFCALYAIGIFYGMKQFGQMLLKMGGLAANGLMEAIAGAFSGSPAKGIVMLVFAFVGLYLVLALGWIPGLFLAGKALLNAKQGYSPDHGDSGGGGPVVEDDWAF